ncbi:MAG TPA: hypothetical protein VMW46_02945 [Candidatus Desulfaltia sp.]|nr:hypothetical protein [Candidatus Desulfaltia sp.]
MKRGLFSRLIIGVGFLQLALLADGKSPARSQAVSAYADSLREVFALRDKIKDIHPLLATIHPVAISEGEDLLIFKPDETRKCYEFDTRTPAPMTIPKGVRAAFPLEVLDGQPACVVTGEVFDSMEGYVLIFHEFVHCHQYLACEQKLKGRLLVYRRAPGGFHPGELLRRWRKDDPVLGRPKSGCSCRPRKDIRGDIHDG